MTLCAAPVIAQSGWSEGDADNGVWVVLMLIGIGFVLVYAGTFYLILRSEAPAVSQETGASKMRTNRLVQLRNENEALQKRISELEAYEAAAIHSEDGIVIANADGEIQWVSPGFTRMTGYTLDRWREIRGETILDSSFNIHIVSVIHEVLRKKLPVTYETSIYTRHAKKIWIRSAVIPLYKGDDLEKFIIVDKDITRQKEAQEELRQKGELIEFLTASDRALNIQLE
ncbi:MAG: PAS domain S-box protein [Bacteroidota bacterium]